VEATVIFVDFIMHFCYMFFNSTYYSDKLRNVLKEFIWWWTLCFLVFIWYMEHVGGNGFAQVHVWNMS